MMKYILKIVKALLLATLFQMGSPNPSSQYYSPSQPCASLFSGRGLVGETFPLTNLDESVRLLDDHRAPDSSWTKTESIKVESGCSLDICNDTYVQGTCLTLQHGNYPTVSTLGINGISSSSCICHKECKCSDIHMKKSSCARAYLKGGCKSCYSQYTDLKGEEESFSRDFVGKVEAIKLRPGCSLTLYEEEEFGEDGKISVITDETVENFNFPFQSYQCTCDDKRYRKPPTKMRSPGYPPLVDVNSTLDEVIKMLSNKQFSNHPGVRAAFQSLRAGRSSKNAYILLLGSTGSGKSTAINLLFDTDIAATGGMHSTTTDIHEYRIPVAIDEIGVKNSELRVIDTPGMCDTRGLHHDAKYLATLDAYLSNHEELKHRIPNVVLVFHKFHDNRFGGEGSNFVKMLRGLDSFRTRITDENYSNVIFVLSHFCSETDKVKTRPDARLAQFQSVIQDYSLFPKPIIISVAENKPHEYNLPIVNGYYKLPNNEYYPKNLFRQMELITQKRGDMIGLGVLRSAFRDSENFQISNHTFKLLEESNKVSHYFNMLAHAFFQINKTEISQHLQETWDNKIGVELKRKFPGSLPYLQKALSIRNINTMGDVPKTSIEILELLTVIKHDDATRELLKVGLGIQAPKFPQSTIAGHGYNVFGDNSLSSSPFILDDVRGSDIGFLIPTVLTSKLDPGTSQNFYLFDDRDAYVESRVKSLGLKVDGALPGKIFTGKVKPGCNIKAENFNNNGSFLSATREVKMFDFQLNDKPDLHPDFERAVKALEPYDENDYENVGRWNKFFTDYGTHVVKNVYGGGAIQIKLKSAQPRDTKLAEALHELMKFTEDLSIMSTVRNWDNATGPRDKEMKTVVVIPEGVTHSLTFYGGDSAYHTDDLTKMSVEEASKLLQNWKRSLKFSPAILTSEMQLVPINRIVQKLGQNYSAEIGKTAGLLFTSNLKYVPPKKGNSPEAGNAPEAPRERTEGMDEVFRKKAENDKIYENMMLELKRMDMELKLKDLELKNRTLEWEKERARLDMEFNLNKTRLEEMGKTERLQAQLEFDRQKAELDQAREESWRKIKEEERKEQQRRDDRYYEMMGKMSQKKSGSSFNRCSPILSVIMMGLALSLINFCFVIKPLST